MSKPIIIGVDGERITQQQRDEFLRLSTERAQVEQLVDDLETVEQSKRDQVSAAGSDRDRTVGELNSTINELLAISDATPKQPAKNLVFKQRNDKTLLFLALGAGVLWWMKRRK